MVIVIIVLIIVWIPQHSYGYYNIAMLHTHPLHTTYRRETSSKLTSTRQLISRHRRWQ